MQFGSAVFRKGYDVRKIVSFGKASSSQQIFARMMVLSTQANTFYAAQKNGKSEFAPI
jgi:hypothetical protein